MVLDSPSIVAVSEGGDIIAPLDDVASSTDPISGKPPMGQVLSLRDLRDVMAYLQTLR